MAWTPKYNAISAKLLMRYVMAIVQRDQRAALDNVAGANVLPGLAGYYFSERPVKQFPAFSLRTTRRVFVRDTSGTRRGSYEAAAGIAVLHQDPEAAAELLYDYLEAMCELFESLAISDFYPPTGGLTLTHPALAGGSLALSGLPATTHLMDVWVAADDSAVVGRTRDGFATSGVVSLVIEVEEQATGM